MISELDPALFWLGSSDVRKLARQRKRYKLIKNSRVKRSLPFCELREQCKPERPKNDQNRARCWLPQHAQQGKKKGSHIIPKCFQHRPRELQSSQRAPEELQRASQEPPDLPTEPLKLPRAVQGASKGSPRDPLGGILGRFGPPN